MPTKSYTLADNATVTVNTTDNGVEFNAGMDAITKAVNSKLNSLNPIYSEATSLESGLMSATDKAKLDAIDTSKFVTVVSGKQLSTEDYTTAEKNKLESLTGGTTYGFDKKVTLESGFTTASSISSDFGVYNTINIKDNSTVKAENCYINLSSGELVLTGSEIRANNTNVAGIPTFTSGFKTADSVNSNFGDDNHVNLGHRSKLNLASDSTLDADHSYIDLSHGEIRLNYSKLAFSSSGNESITGNPIFAGTPTFLHGASGLSASGGISYSDATTTTSGLMSKEDKAKLDAIDTSQFVIKEDGKGLSTNDYTTAEKNKLASLTISPTFTGIPRFEKGLKLGSGSDALKSMTINDGKLQIAIGSKTYTFTPDSSASTQNNLLTPTITFNPAQMDTIKGVKPYSFSYTITSDATSHSYYYTDSRYPNWRYPDDHDIIFSDDYALSNTINNVTILDAEAETTSGTITYYITVPATDNYSEKTFTYSIKYTNC